MASQWADNWPHNPAEQEDMAKAIAASIRDLEVSRQAAESADPAYSESDDGLQGDAPRAAVARSRNIQDCIADLLGKPSPELQRLQCSDGDTWVFINPPAREPEHSAELYREICSRYNTPFRAKSSTLKASESPLILKQLENPTQQFRVQRRFGVKKQQMLEAGIKYVLDLTPPLEGGEAVELTCELSCPTGILNWVYQSKLYAVSDILVAAQEQLDPTPSRGECPSTVTSTDGRPDYSPLRHRVAIERVLLNLHGVNIDFGSAPVLYTTVMTAVKHLQIPPHCLSSLADYVVTWLRAVPNCVFIELHPEITLKIADCLQIPLLCQDAFSILVGEAALAKACEYNDRLRPPDRLSIHSRLTDCVDESWETRIQYARLAFKDRVERLVFHDLLGEMAWVRDLPSVAAVHCPDHPDCHGHYQSWLQLLKDFARGAVYHLLASFYEDMPGLGSGPSTNVFSRKTDVFITAFDRMTYKQRVFTRSFWKTLMQAEFPRNQRKLSNEMIKPSVGFKIKTTYRPPEREDLIAAGEINFISTEKISKATDTLFRHFVDIYGDATSATGPSYEATSDDVADYGATSPRKRRRIPDVHQLPFRPAAQGPAVGEENRIYRPEPQNLPIDWRPVGNDERYRLDARIRATDSATIARGWQDHLDVLNFDGARFRQEVEISLARFARIMLMQTVPSSMALDETDVVLCLDEGELKYLPLWAGGSDDGSNGVFEEELPYLRENEAFGPARDGLGRRNISASEKEFDYLSTTLGDRTVATSQMVNDGRSVLMDRRSVYAGDEVESVGPDDSASTFGTDASWDGVTRDDASVGTSTGLSSTMARLPLNLSASAAESVTDFSTATGAFGHASSQSFGLSDDESTRDETSDLDGVSCATGTDQVSHAGGESDYEMVEPAPPAAVGADVGKGKQPESTRLVIAKWAESNPAEASRTINHRELVQESPDFY